MIGSVFKNPQSGCLLPLDNNIRNSQADGHLREIHNVCSVADIESLYDSGALSRLSP